MSTPTNQAAWDDAMQRRSDLQAHTGDDIPPPTTLTAHAGVGQVTLRWDPVPGAVGYLVHRAGSPDGPFLPVDHHGGDVLAVPGPPYVDTTGEPGQKYRYAVASVADVAGVGPLGTTVMVASTVPGPHLPTIDIDIDGGAPGRPLDRPWAPMIGSERLSQLLCTDLTGGRVIGQELREALQRLHDEIGVGTVRAHAIFHDDTAVYNEVDGRPVHDFTVVDQIYDVVMGLGLRPVVEIGFMPTDLARDPERTVFDYRAVISPPKDWGAWAALVSDFVTHLRQRYGADEVAGWDFEVWNEANLEVFWSGSQAEWFRLYDETAKAVKDVDPRLAVGGPASAAAGWVGDFLAHARASGSAVDFLSTHTYGSPPLDLRAALSRHGFPDARLLWTEWGVTPTHFNPVNDSVFAGVFLLSGMHSAAGRVDALSYWVASDHFEELGRPPRLLHGGFGLLTVGGLAKPRYTALRMLAALGDTELTVEASGDGANGLVQAWVTRTDHGFAVLVWNGTLNQDQSEGAAILDRDVTIRLSAAPADRYTLQRTTLAAGQGDLVATAGQLGISDWPTPEQWEQLSTLAAPPVSTEPVTAAAGVIHLNLRLPQPCAVLLQLVEP